MAFRPERLAEGNLCVIWVDDMIDVWTWREAFGPRIETPNLDAMMARAVRFSTLDALCRELDCQPGDLLARHREGTMP